MDRLIGAPLRAVFQRGIDDGTFRRAFDAHVLSTSFVGMAIAAVDAGLPGRLGIDATSELVASLFLGRGASVEGQVEVEAPGCRVASLGAHHRPGPDPEEIAAVGAILASTHRGS